MNAVELMFPDVSSLTRYFYKMYYIVFKFLILPRRILRFSDSLAHMDGYIPCSRQVSLRIHCSDSFVLEGSHCRTTFLLCSDRSET